MTVGDLEYCQRECVEGYEAALVLGQIGSDAEAAIPALTKRLRDGSRDVRKVAARALDKIRQKK